VYTKFIVSSITIGIAVFVIYILLLLSPSIDGSYPNERLLLYALTDQQQTNQSTSALNNKAFALSSLENYSEAISYYDKALAIEPDDALALDNKNKILDLLSKQK
jgi:tetratricopeptide (TPR) repeat protein